jgi:hypothetical protein
VSAFTQAPLELFDAAVAVAEKFERVVARLRTHFREIATTLRLPAHQPGGLSVLVLMLLSMFAGIGAKIADIRRFFEARRNREFALGVSLALYLAHFFLAGLLGWWRGTGVFGASAEPLVVPNVINGTTA